MGLNLTCLMPDVVAGDRCRPLKCGITPSTMAAPNSCMASNTKKWQIAGRLGRTTNSTPSLMCGGGGGGPTLVGRLHPV